jgi:hypothetical protein
MKPTLKVANVDGKKSLLVNGRTVMTKKQVTDQIAALTERATKRLPAARASLNAQDLLAAAQASIDRQIDEATEAKAALETLLPQLD